MSRGHQGVDFIPSIPYATLSNANLVLLNPVILGNDWVKDTVVSLTLPLW